MVCGTVAAFQKGRYQRGQIPQGLRIILAAGAHRFTNEPAAIVIDQRPTVGEGFAVTIALGGGIIGTMRVDIGMDQAESIADAMAGDDDSTLRAAAVAWNTIGREAVFTANGVSHSAAECTEWWA